MRRRQIDFLGIGAPKCGTSWLARCLDEHPAIAIPVKETHFFSRDQEFARGISYYESQLVGADPKVQRLGEFCPNYLSRELVPSRIWEYKKELQFLVVLRDPIERAYSHFLHEVRSGQVQLGRGILAASCERPEYLEHGFYASALRRYWDLFGRESTLVLIYEELQRDPGETLRRAYEFLRVDPGFVPPSAVERVNTSRVPRWAAVERGYDIAARILSSPTHKHLRRAIARTQLPALVRALNTRRGPLPPLSEDERRGLVDVFAADVHDLETLLGRRLPWRSFGGQGETDDGRPSTDPSFG